MPGDDDDDDDDNVDDDDENGNVGDVDVSNVGYAIADTILRLKMVEYLQGCRYIIALTHLFSLEK